MAKTPEEWLEQAYYDIDTAGDMLEKNRNFYAVFMCHLAVEKALKGLLWKRTDTIPPRTHDLTLLVRKIGIEPSNELREFLVDLNNAQVTTHYPEDFKRLQIEFNKKIVIEIIDKSKEVVEWIKSIF